VSTEVNPSESTYQPGLFARLVGRLTAETHHGRSILDALLRYFVTGVLSVVVDVGVLTLLHSVAGVGLVASTVLAYAGGLVVNYTLNRSWTFRSSDDHSRTLARYAVLVAFNFLSTLGIVVGLTAAGLYYLLAKLIAVALNAGINFLAARHWVFAPRSS
jgi:putative flippase GtrA